MSTFCDRIEQVRELVFFVISPRRGGCDTAAEKFSKFFDWFIALLIIFSSSLAFVLTFDLPSRLRAALLCIDDVVLWIFTAEYLLRVWTADLYFKSDTRKRPFERFRRTWKFIWSPLAIIDLIAILPFLLPVRVVANQSLFSVLRLFRAARLLRYAKRYEIVIDNMWAALRSQRKELRVSLMVISALMMVASVLMYVAEHERQPDEFSNAFSGLWWAVSTITTVGYGDIYPKTVLGKICGVVIAFAGVAAIAVPTAIINSGFVKGSLKRSEFKKILSQHDAEQDKQLAKQREMIDDLAKRFAEFEDLQRKRDQEQDAALGEQRKAIDELIRSFADFVEVQRETDGKQNEALRQQGVRLDQFTTAASDRLVEIKDELGRLPEALNSRVAEFGNRLLEENKRQNDAHRCLAMDQFKGTVNEQVAKLWEEVRSLSGSFEGRLGCLEKGMEEQRQMTERFFAPKGKSDGFWDRIAFWSHKGPK